MALKVTGRTIARTFPLANLSGLQTSNPGSGRPWINPMGSVHIGPYTPLDLSSKLDKTGGTIRRAGVQPDNTSAVLVVQQQTVDAYPYAMLDLDHHATNNGANQGGSIVRFTNNGAVRGAIICDNFDNAVPGDEYLTIVASGATSKIRHRIGSTDKMVIGANGIDVNGTYIRSVGPEGTSGEVRLGAAYGRKGVYSDSDLFLTAENGFGFYVGASDDVATLQTDRFALGTSVNASLRNGRAISWGGAGGAFSNDCYVIGNAGGMVLRATNGMTLDANVSTIGSFSTPQMAIRHSSYPEFQLWAGNTAMYSVYCAAGTPLQVYEYATNQNVFSVNAGGIALPTLYQTIRFTAPSASMDLGSTGIVSKVTGSNPYPSFMIDGGAYCSTKGSFAVSHYSPIHNFHNIDGTATFATINSAGLITPQVFFGTGPASPSIYDYLGAGVRVQNASGGLGSIAFNRAVSDAAAFEVRSYSTGEHTPVAASGLHINGSANQCVDRNLSNGALRFVSPGNSPCFEFAFFTQPDTPIVSFDNAGVVSAKGVSLWGNAFLANSATPAVPVGGGILFVQSGALKYMGTSGTVTTLGPA